MKKLVSLFLLMALIGIFPVNPAHAVIIDFVPNFQTVTPPNTVDVDVSVSGLGSSGAPSLGAFDLTINYDSSILDATDVVFGDFLGSSIIASISGFNLTTPGLVELFEVSLLSNPELDSLQPSGFSLATIAFNSIAEGTSPLGFSSVILSDGFGNQLPAASVEGSVSVPEPSTAFLLILGLGMFVLRGFSKLQKESW